MVGGPGQFSEGGHYLTLDADSPEVFDVRTGEQVDFGLRGFATGYEWLDADTLVILSADTEHGQLRLLTCTVPAADCQVAVELGDVDEFPGDLALPVGEAIED
jgi:hypothetical protein